MPSLSILPGRGTSGSNGRRFRRGGRLEPSVDSLAVAKVVTAIFNSSHRYTEDSLLVRGIGIMNIVLATMIERTREIGIRRAMGARRGRRPGRWKRPIVLHSVPNHGSVCALLERGPADQPLLRQLRYARARLLRNRYGSHGARCGGTDGHNQYTR